MKKNLIDKLSTRHFLDHGEWVQLISGHTEEDTAYAGGLAREITLDRFGKRIWFRGIIEFSNYCGCGCLYCGLRGPNTRAERYRLTDEDILESCEAGFRLGYRTFVLQSGEDPHNTDEWLTGIVKRIKASYPDCAVTLSVGERSRSSYEALYASGADRYLLRHEAASPELYAKLHPARQTLQNRMRCLKDLKEIGFQTGAGMMVGVPYQTAVDLAADMEFMAGFGPAMIGIGPFIPHHQTPFAAFPAGNTDMTLFLLSLCRIMLPEVLLPATTALGTTESSGRVLGVLAGCNVIMPNLSPLSVRKKYMIYDNKAGTGDDPASGLRKLREQMDSIGYEVVVSRGDYGSKE